MRTPGAGQLGAVAIIVIAIAAPASAQDREWREFGERIGHAAAVLANSVVAEVAAALEEASQQRGRQVRRARDERDVLTEEFSQSYPVSRNPRLRVETLYGNITVERGGDDTIHVRALKRVRNASEAQARRLMPGIAVVVTARGNTVDVTTENRTGGNWQGQVDYTITVPRATQLQLESRSGNIAVRGVEGDVRAETVSGNVTATDVKRARELSSFSGNITLSDSDGEDFSGESHSGNIVIRNVKATVLALESTSGTLQASDIEAARASLATLSGSIEYQGRFARGGRYEMKSHSGAIRVVPVDANPFQLEANTFSGSVRSDFPVTLNSQGRERRNFSAPVQAEAGPTGDSAALFLRSFSGSIVITKR